MGKHSAQQLLGLLLIICVILLSCSCAVKKTLAAEEPTEAPERRRTWKGHELPPEPHKGYYDWLIKCGEKLTDRCGEEMGDFLFYKRMHLSYVCCDKLVKTGKKCHKEMAKTLARSKDFKKNKAQIMRRSKQAWDQCSFIDKCVAGG